MNKKLLLSSIAISSLLFSGCTVTVNTGQTPEPTSTPSASTQPTKKPTEKPTPKTTTKAEITTETQVAYAGGSNFSDKEKTEIKTKVVEPIKKFYNDQKMRVVSITIDRFGGDIGAGLNVDVIIDDNDGNSDPITHGFLHLEVAGSLPTWQPDIPEVGYQG